MPRESSSVWVLPTMVAPPATGLCPPGAVRRAGSCEASQSGFPAPVTCPAISNRSLAAKVRLASGPAGAPSRRTVTWVQNALNGSSTLFPRPMDEAALDHEEQEIEPIAERAGRKDRRVHVGHGEQLLRLEHPMAEAVDRSDEHLGDHDDHQRQRYAVAQPDEGLRQRLEQHDVDQH